MLKVFILLFVVLLALVSAGAYLFLSEKIDSGERQIADGQRKIEKEEPKLEAGKAKLKAGRQELSEGRQEYAQAEGNFFLMWADRLLDGGKEFRGARWRIAEGDRQIAKGEIRIKDGEERLDAGKLELLQGREQLLLVKDIRVACAFVVLFFVFVSIALVFFWRKSLVRTFYTLMHKSSSRCAVEASHCISSHK